MISMGNTLANSIWEADLRGHIKPIAASSREDKERYVLSVGNIICMRGSFCRMCNSNRSFFISPAFESRPALACQIHECIKLIAKNPIQIALIKIYLY